jgi:hypothetical protein
MTSVDKILDDTKDVMLHALMWKKGGVDNMEKVIYNGLFEPGSHELINLHTLL